jgi:hypothetical protein
MVWVLVWWIWWIWRGWRKGGRCGEFRRVAEETAGVKQENKDEVRTKRVFKENRR